MPAPELTPRSKSVYALGDFTLNTALASLSLIYASYYLTQIAGLRPVLAGLVPLIGRFIDAVSDPAMGRISDLTRSRWGRRRPYFLLGALPFGLGFALLWVDVPLSSQGARFAYYTGAYCFLMLAMTVLSVPYLALLPEMALGYDERTSLNTYRNVGSIFGIFAAIAIRPVARALGGGATGFALAGVIFGCLLAVPWLAVYAATFERAELGERVVTTGFVEGLRALARHRSFTQLTGLYLTGRIAMDLIGALLILYFTYWIGRSGDFEIAMFVFLVTVVLSLPAWLRISRRRDKSTIFIVGAIWWMSTSVVFVFAGPDSPRWLVFALPALAGIGYAVVDLMPWAMLGEVVDEDDLVLGERREGLYNGVFTFLRKLGGAVGVFLVLAILDLAGFVQGAEQTETARQAIRFTTVLAPVTFLALAVWLARDYPLTRAAHAEIIAKLAARCAAGTGANDGSPALPPRGVPQDDCVR